MGRDGGGREKESRNKPQTTDLLRNSLGGEESPRSLDRSNQCLLKKCTKAGPPPPPHTRRASSTTLF